MDKVYKFFEKYIEDITEDNEVFSYLLQLNSGIGFFKKNKVYTFDLTNIDMIKNHLERLLKTKPYKVAMLEIRSHAAWYLKGIPNTKEIKQAIFKSNTKEELYDILERYEG